MIAADVDGLYGAPSVEVKNQDTSSIGSSNEIVCIDPAFEILVEGSQGGLGLGLPDEGGGAMGLLLTIGIAPQLVKGNGLGGVLGSLCVEKARSEEEREKGNQAAEHVLISKVEQMPAN